MLSLNYNGPDQLVNALNSLFGDRKSTVKVVDVGAGSGLAGQEIFDAGYRNIDAVDASEGLLGIAKRKGFYGNVHLCTIGTDKIPIPDDTYDVCTICGAMIENHIPMEGIRDITRIVKPGGYIINVFREEAMRYPWYKEALGPFFNQLEIEGVWEEVGREIHPQFFAGLDGILFIHKVL
jgi:SAM-dependent methyltransferase